MVNLNIMCVMDDCRLKPFMLNIYFSLFSLLYYVMMRCYFGMTLLVNHSSSFGLLL